MIEDRPKRRGLHPVAIALAVAILGVLAMLIVDHGPWNRPHVQTADVAYYRAAGAAVQPTTPKPALEPEPPGPKPVQPPDPVPD